MFGLPQLFAAGVLAAGLTGCTFLDLLVGAPPFDPSDPDFSFPPMPTAAALDARVLARKERLLRVAAALDGRDDELHPAGVAIVHRLLTRPSVSPLFNPQLEEQILDDALHRVEACTAHENTLATV